MDISEFLEKSNIFAVVGVSTDPSKYGHRVFFKLLHTGYTAYAIHPEAGEALGHTRYTTLSNLPQKPDVVSIVVPPEVTESIVRECKKLGIKKVWMQPGSESKEAIQFCYENNIKVIHDTCIILNT